MILLINYYQDSNPERQKEYDYCLHLNVLNPLIKSIIVFHEHGVKIPEKKKIISKIVKNKPTFSDFFKYGNQFKGIKILANLDIYFNQTLEFATIIKPNKIFALCRWNKDETGLHFYNQLSSQDVWIWTAKINVNCNFGLGIPACDNAILHKLISLKYEVSSPSKIIQSIHVHNSNVRNYENEMNGNKFRVNEPIAFLKTFK